jgi:hypothetical protein
MGSRGRWAALAAALSISLTIAGDLCPSRPRPSLGHSRVPIVDPHIDHRAGLFDRLDAYGLQGFSIEVEASNSSEVALLAINTTQPCAVSDLALRTFEKKGIGKAGTTASLSSSPRMSGRGERRRAPRSREY